MASVNIDVPGSEKISNVSNVPTGLPTASGITSRRKRKKKKEANEDKELVSKIMRGNVLQRNTRQQQEFEYLESGNENYSIYILTELNALNVIHQVPQGGCISLWH